MEVTLAWPAAALAESVDYVKDAGITGDIDETVDVSDDVANRLIRDGLARLPDTVPMRLADVEAVAAAENIDISGARTVADKRAAVKAARQEREG